MSTSPGTATSSWSPWGRTVGSWRSRRRSRDTRWWVRGSRPDPCRSSSATTPRSPSVSDPTDGPDRGQDRPTAPSGEQIGSVGEEAAKLFVALSGWAKDQGSAGAGSAAGAAGAVSDALHDINEHLATGG